MNRCRLKESSTHSIPEIPRIQHDKAAPSPQRKARQERVPSFNLDIKLSSTTTLEQPRTQPHSLLSHLHRERTSTQSCTLLFATIRADTTQDQHVVHHPQRCFYPCASQGPFNPVQLPLPRSSRQTQNLRFCVLANLLQTYSRLLFGTQKA